VINLMEVTETNSWGEAFAPYEKPMRALAESMKVDCFFDRMLGRPVPGTRHEGDGG
jgi:hypothetical protein